MAAAIIAVAMLTHIGDMATPMEATHTLIIIPTAIPTLMLAPTSALPSVGGDQAAPTRSGELICDPFDGQTMDVGVLTRVLEGNCAHTLPSAAPIKVWERTAASLVFL